MSQREVSMCSLACYLLLFPCLHVEEGLPVRRPLHSIEGGGTLQGG